MKLPEIPTDNLYKFMALSGLTLVILSFLPNFHAYNLKVSLIRLDGEVKTLTEEVEWVSSNLKKLDNEIESMKVRIAKLTGISVSEITLALSTRLPLSDIRKEKEIELEKHSKELDELRAKRSRYVEMFRKQAIKTIQISTKQQEYVYLGKMIMREVVIAGCAGIFGVLLAVNGFVFWYKKLQLPQDIIIGKKAEDKQKQ